MAYITEAYKQAGTMNYDMMDDCHDIDEEYYDADGEAYMDF